MGYFNTKYEKDSAKITALIAIILLLLIFVVGPTYLDPPEEYGVAVNFGTTDFGSGRVQPKAPIKSEPLKINEKPNVEESIPENSEPKEVKEEEVLTQETEEAIAIKKQKEAEAKAKAEAERIEKEKRDAEERKRKAEEEKKKKLDALIGGIGKSDGKESGSEGDDNTVGDKGQLDGSPYASSYFGQPGTGDGGVGYGLKGRGRPSNSKVVPDCQEEGRVVVEIHVNKNGKVTKAIPGKKGTTGDGCLYDAAKKTALTYKWPADSKAPTKQVGFVVVNFRLSGN